MHQHGHKIKTKREVVEFDKNRDDTYLNFNMMYNDIYSLLMAETGIATKLDTA